MAEFERRLYRLSTATATSLLTGIQTRLRTLNVMSAIHGCPLPITLSRRRGTRCRNLDDTRCKESRSTSRNHPLTLHRTAPTTRDPRNPHRRLATVTTRTQKPPIRRTRQLPSKWRPGHSTIGDRRAIALTRPVRNPRRTTIRRAGTSILTTAPRRTLRHGGRRQSRIMARNIPPSLTVRRTSRAPWDRRSTWSTAITRATGRRLRARHAGRRTSRRLRRRGSPRCRRGKCSRARTGARGRRTGRRSGARAARGRGRGRRRRQRTAPRRPWVAARSRLPGGGVWRVRAEGGVRRRMLVGNGLVLRCTLSKYSDLISTFACIAR